MTLREVWQAIKRVDVEFHNRLLARYPRFAGNFVSVSAFLVDSIFGSPLFAVILALVLVVLAITEAHSVVTVSMYMAWMLSIFWVSKSVRSLNVISQAIVVVFSGAILAGGYYSFAHWALIQYDNQHAGRVHIIRFTPFEVDVGKIPQLNIYYENTGDSSVYFKATSEEIVVVGLLSHPESDLKITEESLYKHLHDNFPKTSGETLAVSPHGNGFFTLPGPWTMAQEDIKNIDKGDSLVLTVGLLRYQDRPDKPDVEFCVLWGRKDKVVIECPTHNRE